MFDRPRLREIIEAPATATAAEIKLLAERAHNSPASALTLRDQFAMAALTGIAAKSGFIEAAWAYKAADAMMKEREK